MKMPAIKSKKYIIVFLFLVAAAASLFLVKKVSVNYNISDYLDEKTETKISLDVINDEFGSVADIQVMLENVTKEEALSARDIIKNVPNVLTVSFDAADENHYKNGNALYIALIDGDEYSEAAKNALSDIRTALSERFEQKTHFGGGVIAKEEMRSALEGQIVYILAVSIAFVVIIMLLTSDSWLEPIVLLVASGFAILINMGTNAVFGKISYVTNTVAAILQLALSIDYSIVLLNNYRAQREAGEGGEAAMKKAVKAVLKPVSASALTTIAGLLALLFMSFKIGFDIGIVLIKGIVVSGVTAVTLLPSLLLIFEKALIATRKKKIVLQGRWFCDFSFKFAKVVVPVALAVIVGCGVLQEFNSYTFTDTNVDNVMDGTFGKNNSVVVVYKKGENDARRERALIDALNALKKEDGTPVLKSYNAFSNTVGEYYDVEKVSKTLDLPESDVEMLFAMYELYNDSTLVTLSPAEFSEYAADLIGRDEFVRSMIDEKTAKAIGILSALKGAMETSFSPEELLSVLGAASSEGLGVDIDLFTIKQLYGLYHFDAVADVKVELKTMIDFLISAAETPEAAVVIGEETVGDLKTLKFGMNVFSEQMERNMDQSDFRRYLERTFGVTLGGETVAKIYAEYSASAGEAAESAALCDLLGFTVSNSYVTEAEAAEKINSYTSLYKSINDGYVCEGFLPALSTIAEGLTGERQAIGADEYAVQQLYIMYFIENDALELKPISGRRLTEFLLSACSSSTVLKSRLGEDGLNKIADIGLIDGFLSETSAYDYKKLAEKLSETVGKLKSVSLIGEVGADKVSGVYVKYALENDVAAVESITAKDLLGFVAAEMERNDLLKAKVSEENAAKVKDAEALLKKAEELFVGRNYSRMIISVDLPDEGKQSAEFVDTLLSNVKAVFGKDAHIAGTMVSAAEMKETFAKDKLFISVFTIIAIFVIVMLIFRSASLPVLLVTVIQGAIFIAMSTSLITGPMFFMSYIVANCILMGATIDYGILMSSNYVRYRESLDKREALYRSVRVASPTVFTSGLIMTVCGFVIGFITTQNAISSVGILLGKGTLVSGLMIMFVLPSVLYLFDKFILKFSLKGKKKNSPEKDESNQQ